MKKRYIVLIVFLGFVCFFAFVIYSGFLGGGTYGYAQQYEFNTTDSVLIKAMIHFKEENPEYRVPATLSLFDRFDNFGKYFCYLYYRKENKLILCFVMSMMDNPNKTSIYFHAINDGLVLGNWKLVNKDFDRDENLEIKKDFQKRVLDELKIPYTDEGNNALIFWK